MRHASFLLGLLFASAPGAAQEWRQAREVEIRLSNFDIEPAKIALKAGEPVRLRLINNGASAYVVDGGELFAAGRIRNRDTRRIADGKIRVPGGETAEVSLVPRAGTYSLRSSNLLYRILGMRSRIEVR